jgi:hypothetical protein
VRGRVCYWCKTIVQAAPGTPYCEAMGFFFVGNPFQCFRGNSPVGGKNQKVLSRGKGETGKRKRDEG